MTFARWRFVLFTVVAACLGGLIGFAWRPGTAGQLGLTVVFFVGLVVLDLTGPWRS